MHALGPQTLPFSWNVPVVTFALSLKPVVFSAMRVRPASLEAPYGRRRFVHQTLLAAGKIPLFAPQSMPIRLRLFGPPRLAHGDGSVALAFERRNQLLAYLALCRGAVRRSELAAVLWPDAP